MSDKPPLKIVLIGAGAIGRRHMNFINSTDDMTLVAIVEPHASGKSTAEDANVPWYQDCESMLNDMHPDGAVIATPNAQHTPAGVLCAQAGVNMLVEKPIADTVAAASTLVDAATANNVHLLVGHHRRHNPVIRKAREFVRNGSLGRISSVSAQWMACKPDYYYEVDWRSQQGGGPILINLIHDIDCLRYIVGEIDAVQAIATNHQRGFEVEDTAAVLLRFTNGALGTLSATDSSPAPWSWETASGENPDYPHDAEANCYLIGGTEASLAVPTLRTWRHEPNRDWFKPFSMADHTVEPRNPLAEQMAHFARVMRGDEEPRITGEDGARTLAVTLAIRDAADTGKMISTI